MSLAMILSNNNLTLLPKNLNLIDCEMSKYKGKRENYPMYNVRINAVRCVRLKINSHEIYRSSSGSVLFSLPHYAHAAYYKI